MDAAALAAARQRLNGNVRTVVTHADGRRYVVQRRDDGDGEREVALPIAAAANTGTDTMMSTGGFGMSTTRSYGFVVDSAPDAQLHRVRPRLYVGSQDAAVNRDGMRDALLDEEACTPLLDAVPLSYEWTVICVATGVRVNRRDDAGVAIRASAASVMAIKRVDVPILDMPDEDFLAAARLPACIVAVRHALANGDCVLVHCNAGVSRAPSVVIGMLMSGALYGSSDGDTRMSYDDAYALVKRSRSAMKPNSGFVRQLRQYGELLQQQQQKHGGLRLPEMTPL